jgi:hypothetical protein
MNPTQPNDAHMERPSRSRTTACPGHSDLCTSVDSQDRRCCTSSPGARSEPSLKHFGEFAKRRKRDRRWARDQLQGRDIRYQTMRPSMLAAPSPTSIR